MSEDSDPLWYYPQIMYWATHVDESDTEFYSPPMVFYHWRCKCGVGGHGFGLAEDARLDAEAHARGHAR